MQKQKTRTLCKLYCLCKKKSFQMRNFQFLSIYGVRLLFFISIVRQMLKIRFFTSFANKEETIFERISGIYK